MRPGWAASENTNSELDDLLQKFPSIALNFATSHARESWEESPNIAIGYERPERRKLNALVELVMRAFLMLYKQRLSRVTTGGCASHGPPETAVW